MSDLKDAQYENEHLSFNEFYKRLTAKHGSVWMHRWPNCPESRFFYDRDDYDASTPVVGAYTNDLAWSIR